MNDKKPNQFQLLFPGLLVLPAQRPPCGLPAASQPPPNNLPVASQPPPSSLPEVSLRTPSRLPADSQLTPSRLPADSQSTPSHLPADSQPTPSRLPADSHQSYDGAMERKADVLVLRLAATHLSNNVHNMKCCNYIQLTLKDMGGGVKSTHWSGDRLPFLTESYYGHKIS
jgi:hypothetical protein